MTNILPEFDNVHPAVIIRSGQKLSNPHLVIPITSVNHEGDVYAHKLMANPNPKKPDLISWAVCNHIYTVASERLRPMRDVYDNERFPKLGEQDMHHVGRLMRVALNRIIQASLTFPSNA